MYLENPADVQCRHIFPRINQENKKGEGGKEKKRREKKMMRDGQDTAKVLKESAFCIFRTLSFS